jgi:hypothetical protein
VPGKHAPESPTSFYLSVARAGAGALAVLGLVIAIVLVAVGSNDNPTAVGTSSQTPTTITSTPPATSTTPSVEPTRSERPLVARARVVVEVLNGTTTSGLAAGVEAKLRSDGYSRVSVGNTSAPAERTVIFYKPTFKREAERMLADRPELLRVKQATPSSEGSAPIVVVLGPDYEA